MDVVEDPFPLVEMPIFVRAERKPARVFLAPDGKVLEFKYQDGYVQTVVTVLDGHKMLVIEP
jgi:hypothetical protein